MFLDSVCGLSGPSAELLSDFVTHAGAFLAAESAAHWLQGEGRDRGKDRGGRDKRWRGVSKAGRRNFIFALENTRNFN